MFIKYRITCIYSQLPISRTRKGPGKVSDFKKMSDLSDIQSIMQIRHEMRSVG